MRCETCGQPTERRSEKQNAALHTYCRQLASDLNDAGYDCEALFTRKSTPSPFTEHVIKEHVWKPIQEAMYGEAKTSRLTPEQVGNVYRVVSKKMGEMFGVTTAFTREEF